MLIPITWIILDNEVIASGSRLLQVFSYGAIGFCVGIMVAGTIAVYHLTKMAKEKSGAK